ncbi:MAG: hypothetical protein NTY22_01885 [Proteobacteria bacterium]|nr:hypothetical protein [Pseudomonadota bacterium]
MNILISMAIFLSSFYVYGESDTNKQDSWQIEHAKVFYYIDLRDANIGKDIWILATRGEYSAPKEFIKKYKDYAFFKLDTKTMTAFPAATDDHPDKIYDENAVLSCPKTSIIKAVTPDVWFVLVKDSEDINTFFPARIVDHGRTLQINGTSYVEYIIKITSIDEYTENYIKSIK